MAVDMASLVDIASIGLLVVVPLLVIIEGLVVLVVWGMRGGGFPWLIPSWRDGDRFVPGAPVGYWLLLTTASALVGWMASFVGVHALLFNLSVEAAWAGIGISILVIAALPVFWAVVLDRRRHRASGTGDRPQGT